MNDKCVYIGSRVMSASFKNNASFVSRLPTIRRHKSTSLHSPAPHSKPAAAHRYDVNASAENLGKPSLTNYRPLFAHIIHSHFYVLVCNCRNYVLYSFCLFCVVTNLYAFTFLLRTKPRLDRFPFWDTYKIACCKSWCVMDYIFLQILFFKCKTL